MSKFLKFIVHFIVICTILCVVALAVPRFFGVTAEVIESEEEAAKSNLPMGSVTYAIPEKVAEGAFNIPVLVQNKDGIYKYKLVQVEEGAASGQVSDPDSPELLNVQFSETGYVPKIVATIPFIGYLMVATKSIEGLVILGLAVLFLVILYIIAELWKKDPDDDDDYEEDTEPGYVKSKKELRREERRKERRYRDEEREIKEENRRNKKNKKKIRTGGFVDEIDEDDDEYDDYQEARERSVQSATSEAHELLRRGVAATTADDEFEYEDEDEEDVRTARPARRSSARPAAARRPQAPVYEEDEEDEEVPVRKMARPRYTPAQLAAMAQKAGDAPDIVKDDVTKVTLFDYSDIFADEDDDEDYDED